VGVGVALEPGEYEGLNMDFHHIETRLVEQ